MQFSFPVHPIAIHHHHEWFFTRLQRDSGGVIFPTVHNSYPQVSFLPRRSNFYPLRKCPISRDTGHTTAGSGPQSFESDEVYSYISEIFIRIIERPNRHFFLKSVTFIHCNLFLYKMETDKQQLIKAGKSCSQVTVECTVQR